MADACFTPEVEQRIARIEAAAAALFPKRAYVKIATERGPAPGQQLFQQGKWYFAVSLEESPESGLHIAGPQRCESIEQGILWLEEQLNATLAKRLDEAVVAWAALMGRVEFKPLRVGYGVGTYDHFTGWAAERLVRVAREEAEENGKGAGRG